MILRSSPHPSNLPGALLCSGSDERRFECFAADDECWDRSFLHKLLRDPLRCHPSPPPGADSHGLGRPGYTCQTHPAHLHSESCVLCLCCQGRSGAGTVHPNPHRSCKFAWGWLATKPLLGFSFCVSWNFLRCSHLAHRLRSGAGAVNTSPPPAIRPLDSTETGMLL